MSAQSRSGSRSTTPSSRSSAHWSACLMPKVAGSCTLCGMMTFDVLRQHPNGAPIRLGKPLATARRLHFVLVDGSTMSLTFCDPCARNMTPVHYPIFWQNVLEAFRQEIELLEARDPDRHEARVRAF